MGKINSVHNNKTSIFGQGSLKRIGKKSDKNIEKLSSGYKITRAADDASGLAESEKMKAQISALEQAENNANDGINLIQTADGYLNEVQTMLTRMVTLSMKAANGILTDGEMPAQEGINTTYLDTAKYDPTPNPADEKYQLDETNKYGGDRAALEMEFRQLKEEIDRIGKTANFNNLKLFDGSGRLTYELFQAKELKEDESNPNPLNLFYDVDEIKLIANTFSILAFAEYKYDDPPFTYEGDRAKNNNFVADTNTLIGVLDDLIADRATAVASGAFFNKAEQDYIQEIRNNLMEASTNARLIPNVDAYKNNVASLFGNINELHSAEFNINDIIDLQKTLQGSNTGRSSITSNAFYAQIIKWKNVDDTHLTERTKKFVKDFFSAMPITGNPSDAEWKALSKLVDDYVGDSEPKEGFYLQVGETSRKADRVGFSLEELNSEELKIDKLSLLTQKDANDALTPIRTAINDISARRGELGAMQNRLEHTINNLNTTAENVKSAESQIRDSDMAKEYASYVKNNILRQSAQTMLAQGNTQSRQVLKLINN
jgi:flagellin